MRNGETKKIRISPIYISSLIVALAMILRLHSLSVLEFTAPISLDLSPVVLAIARFGNNVATSQPICLCGIQNILLIKMLVHQHTFLIA